MSPTIKLPEKKKRVNNTSKRNNLIHKHVYNTSRWKEMRLNFLMAHPLCGRCLHQKDIIRGAVDVHHIIPISKAGEDIVKINELGFDVKNLETLCDECHKDAHLIRKNNKNNKKIK